MGAELSSIQAPLSVNIELTVGEEELAKVRELWRQVNGTRAGRQGNDTRQGAQYASGAGNAAIGGAGVIRTGGAVSTGTRQQGAHYGRGANATTSGGAGVTRTGGAVSTAGGATPRAGGVGGQRRDIGGAEALQGCSDSTGSVKTRNVTFRKTGRCHRLGCNKCTGRRFDRMNGFIT